MNFDEKTILITGASSGIGKAVVYNLAQKNCRLAICSRNEHKLNEIRNDLSSINNKILPVKCDVAIKDSVDNAHSRIISEFGEIDIAILNSGIGKTGTPETFNSKDAEDIINTNLLGIVYWIEKILPQMLLRKDGIIAGVSSLADNRGFSGSGFYTSSKAAVSIFLEGLRIELKKKGISVFTIKPGFVRTPMTDQNKFEMPFLMEPDKAAELIIKGMEKEKKIIQFPFPTVLITRLIGLLPQSVYEFLTSFDKRN